ncbi:MAG: hypothetical protein R3E86_21970, partial [Pseudomonadales bacterium]
MAKRQGRTAACRRLGGVIGMAAWVLAGCDGGRPATADLDAVPPQPTAKLSVLATGAGISGANGLHFSPDGLLYVASVIGSEIVVLDPDSGEVRQRLTAADGVEGPDDVAFAPDGAFYWTSILTGEVAGYTADGRRVTAARLTPGVNPLTFADDGRLFVSQCFFDDKLYEVDPAGERAPRLIADDLGPGCGLNGMDWGPDGRLYGPRWFRGEVVSFDVDSGERRLEADGIDVPAAVKFDSKGRLHVLDTGRGEVVRIDGDEHTVVARLTPGLDNIAFDDRDRLFVSSFTDGFVDRVEADGSLTELSPGGMAHPGGVTVLNRDGTSQVVVADLHSIRGFDPASGKATFTQRNILGVGALGSALSVAADGDNLILASFTDNNVRVWDPVAEQTLARWNDLALPVSAIRYGPGIAVAVHGTGQVLLLQEDGQSVLAQGFEAPTGLATDGDSLYLTERARGQVLRIARGGSAMEPEVVAQGLEAPEGVAVLGDDLVVVEGETGRVLRLHDGSPVLLAAVSPGTPP